MAETPQAVPTRRDVELLGSAGSIEMQAIDVGLPEVGFVTATPIRETPPRTSADWVGA